MGNKQRLIETGKALYGDRWQTDLARDLGHADGRRMRQWLADERPIPKSVLPALTKLLEQRGNTIRELLESLSRAETDQGQTD